MIGNNRNAKIHSVVSNSLSESKEDGLDTSELETIFNFEDESKISNNKENENEMKFITVKNSRDFEIAVKYTNAAGEEIEAVLQPGGSVDVAEEQVEAVENQLKSAEAPKAEVDLAKMLNEALAPMQAKLEAIEKNASDKAAEEPKFKKQENGAKNFKYEFIATLLS